MAAYRSTDSHPYQRNQMAFPHYYQPVMEGIRPQMNVDPSKTSSAYEQAWPYVGGHGHGYPTPMQLCCGHHRFPGYWTYTPPAYPHIPTSSPPMCFSGGYPAYSEPFYAPYTPPPHYTMELPKYEYDKYMPREYHCCGCPNHPLSHKEGKGVKIEEHEPKAEKKVHDVVSNNYPYPFVWMPSQCMGNEKLKNPDVTEVDDQHDLRKPSEFARADGQEPKVWNGWFPLDINGLANMIQGGNGREYKNGKVDNSVREAEDGKTNPSHQSERNRREFPFPVIWIPNYNMQEGERRKDHERTYSPNSVEEASPALDSTSVVSRSSDDASNRSNMNGYDLKMRGSDVAGKETNEKSIPVKQMELQRSEPESHEKRVRNIPVRQTEGDMTTKETQTRVKRRSSSPEKTSKLPPVCLRVDPLPKKKNGNGSSRSPSPSNRDSAAATNGTCKSATSSSMHGKALADAARQRTSNAGAELKPKEKTIEVVEMSSERKDRERRDEPENHGKTQVAVKHQKDSNANEDTKPNSESIRVLEKSSEKKLEDHINGTQNQVTSNSDAEGHENSSALTSMGEIWTNGEEINGNEAERKVDDMTKEEAMDTRNTDERKALSDTEAAAMIQAAYRGFQVRKWEPLKKLKQIAEVSKQVTDVRSTIEALEASSNEQIDEKERDAVGEIIMRLLLKLDTIQGLHPSFRGMRKSLARELTSLQEKLDSVIAKKSQLRMEDLSIGKLRTPSVGSNGESNQEQTENKLSMAGKDSSEGIIQESHGSAKQNEIAASENSSDSIVHGSQDKMEQGQDQPSIKNDNPSHDDETVNKSGKDEGSGCDMSELQPKTKSELEGIPNEVDELDVKAWEELPRGVIDDPEDDNIDFCNDEENDVDGEELQVAEVTNASDDDFARDGESLKVNEMEELPIGLLDDDATDSEKHEETGTSALASQSEEGECNPALMIHSLTENLRIGLLDDDTTDSEKCEETGTSAQVLQSGEGEYNPALITHSLVDDISKGARLDQQQQQQLEEQEEDQSNGESADWVKVEYEEDGLKGDARENSKVESDSREENDGQSVTTAFRGDGRHGVANEDACLEVKEATVDETPEEEVAVKEAQSEQAIKDDAENKVTLSEQCVTSPLLKEVALPKQVGEMDTNKSLIEENEKLRKTLQKLLEAGNEQLSVISNLTGRVKDLEKKLAKKKRVKTVHCRPSTSKPAFKKSSNNVGFVM